MQHNTGKNLALSVFLSHLFNIKYEKVALNIIYTPIGIDTQDGLELTNSFLYPAL